MTGPRLPLVASMGDPAGVGPELFCHAWARRSEEALLPFAVVGSARLLRDAARSVGLDVPVVPIDDIAQTHAVFDTALPVIEVGDVAWSPGKPDETGARITLAALTRATQAVVAGEAAALITGPIAKSRLQDVGFSFPGQTEFVADACGVAARDAVMMLAGPSLRVVPMTVHHRLADVPGLLSQDLIRRRILIAAKALERDFGLPQARIAVTGLNPHAGEDGRMGDEEIAIIAPALRALQVDGWNVTGPHPADAMFHAAARRGYDLAVCMYHDQALIPLKALDFDQGVNVTLGLPIIRTSPDHGTAFAIAGTGAAHWGPTVAAIRMARECALNRAAS